MNVRVNQKRRGLIVALLALTWTSASLRAQTPPPAPTSLLPGTSRPTLSLQPLSSDDGLPDERLPTRPAVRTVQPDRMPAAEPTSPAPAAFQAPTPAVEPVPAPLPGPGPGPAAGPAPVPAPTATPPVGVPLSAMPDLLDLGEVGGSCASCGHGGGGGCASCGQGGACIPGRFHPCSCCDAHTALGRLTCGLYQCFCCPDPCYTPRWIPEANAAFFADPVRPVSQTRLRYDAALGWTFPDKGEYFWAKIGGKGPKNVETRLNAHILTMYQEIAATPAASAFVEYPYLSLWPEQNPHTAGFGDVCIGTKSVLFDCEMAVLAFQFRTYLPAGVPSKGLGTGHVSLEPALLGYLKLAEQTYLQGQVAEWIPLGGDPDYQGAMIHYHASLNHVLGRLLPDVLVIGTAEFTGYTFQDGAFTDPVLGPYQGASGRSYLTLGPGLRLSVCNRLDFGCGAAFGLDGHGPTQTYRSELRLRY